jgi:pimeloyl-ACP methyl ester carboxylesterase
MAYLQLKSGRRLYYEEEGTGQNIVFIHGWKGSCDVYAEPTRLLQQQGSYRCIRYDQCGHVRSQIPEEGPSLQTLAEDLRELLTALNVQHPILVGWSMGGMTVLEYIRLYGCADLDRIVIVDISPKSLSDDTWSLGRRNGNYFLADLEADKCRMEADFHEFLHSYYLYSRPGYAQLTPEVQRQTVRERMVGFDARVLTNLWYTMNQRDHRSILPQITCPVAIYHAGVLPSCSQAVADYYDAALTAPHRVVRFDGCSHALIAEDPQRFTAELLDFFKL